MQYFQNFVLILSAVVFVSSVNGQRLEDTLATSTNTTFTAASLSEAGRKFYLEQRKTLSDIRANILSEMIANAVLELEAKPLNSTPDKMLAAERARVANPSAAEIQKLYDANKSAFEGRPLSEVQSQIVKYLRHDAEHKTLDAYIERLRTKYKASTVKDVNAVGIGPGEVVATIGTRSITFGEFEQANRVRLNDAEIEIFETVRGELEVSIFSALVTEEARSRNVDVGEFIAAEITNKLRLFTDEERASVESALMRRLFAKYNVKILLREPVRIVQNIGIEPDDPQTGMSSAPVTVIMFSDFQCPACARTHPVLKQTLAEFGNKVRFVVRDFPLESIHENAFQAALAANAAHRQGKFFEYVEVLYRNQEALDKASLVKYAAELNLNVKQFELDFSDARNSAEVRDDQSDGRSHGVGGTPAIFVNGIKVHKLSSDSFRRAIERALSK